MRFKLRSNFEPEDLNNDTNEFDQNGQLSGVPCGTHQLETLEQRFTNCLEGEWIVVRSTVLGGNILDMQKIHDAHITSLITPVFALY